MGDFTAKMSHMKIRLGSRSSKLAMSQAVTMANMLEKALGTRCEPLAVKTAVSPAANVKESFSKGLEEALLRGEIDLAVHSLKDLPARTPERFELALFSERGDVADCLVAAVPMMRLPPGGIIGTGSLRRRAQVKMLRPDLKLADCRGNIDTRLAKLRDYDGIILAACGLERLGVKGLKKWRLPPQEVIPAPGQGVVVLEGLKKDGWRQKLKGLDSEKSRLEATAERAFVARLGATCRTPVGAWANFRTDLGESATNGEVMRLRTFVGDWRSGRRHFRHGAGDDPQKLGIKVAEEMLAQAGEEFWQMTLAE